jgi:hypothetical protein
MRDGIIEGEQVLEARECAPLQALDGSEPAADLIGDLLAGEPGQTQLDDFPLFGRQEVEQFP